MKMKMKKAVGTGLLSLGLVFGLTGLAGATSGYGSGSIDHSGPDSKNRIDYENETRVKVENKNDVNLYNSNDQRASSGEVEVRHNTTGGDAGSGEAMNENSTDATVEVENSAPSTNWANNTNTGNGNGGSITHSGPDSYNEVSSETRTSVEVRNNNDINIVNKNEQYARSGDVEVKDNTTGGDATSGDASNTNSASFTVRVTN